MDIPTHILEIFEGGASIIISDEEDSNLPSISREEDNLTNETTQIKYKNTVHKQQSSMSNIEIPQMKEDSQKHTEISSSPIKRKKEISRTKRENKISSSSKIIKKNGTSHHIKKSLKGNRNTTNEVDTSVFDILPLHDIDKNDEESRMLKVCSHKESSKRLTIPSENYVNSDRKNNKKKHTSESNDINSAEMEFQSYQSLIKQKEKLLELLKDEDEKLEPSISVENFNVKQSQEIKLFQRRKSAQIERKESTIDSASMSIKSVLTRNPEIVPELKNDSLGPKILYDYTNVTNINSSKNNPIISRSKSNESQNEMSQINSKAKLLKVIQNTTSKTLETSNNSYDTGDAYRKALCEQQINFKFQESSQHSPDRKHRTSLFKHQIPKESNNCSHSSISSKIKKCNKNVDLQHESKQNKLEHSSINKKLCSQKESNSNPSRLSISKLPSTISEDNSQIPGIRKHKEIRNQIDDVELNSKNVNISEVREKPIEKKNSFKNHSSSSKSKGSPTEKVEVVPGHTKKIKTPKLFRNEAIKRSGDKTEKSNQEMNKTSTKLKGAGEHLTTKSKNVSEKNQILDLEIRLIRCDHESVEKCDKIKKQNNVNEKNKSTDKAIKSKDNISTNKNASKRKDYIQSTKDAKNCTEKKRKISKQSEINFIPTSEKCKTPLERLEGENNCLNIGGENNLDQEKLKSKEGAKKCSDKRNTLEDNSHISKTGTKRKASVEEDSTKVTSSNLTEKRTKTSNHSYENKSAIQSKNSPPKRLYRELNNLTCTFKESLLPKTIGKRRCSSAWLNFTDKVHINSKNIDTEPISSPIQCRFGENLHSKAIVIRRCSSSWLNSTDNVNDKPKNVGTRPAPIQRRRQTCSGLANLKLTIRRSCDRNEYYIPDIEHHASSDDTDEFNISENRSKNTNEINASLSVKVTENILDNNLTTKDSPCKEIAFDYKSTGKSIKPNIDSNMIFKSTKTCALCNKNSKDLTHHYVSKHKTESYVSRLSSVDIERLEGKTNVAIPVGRHRFRIICVFCKQMVEDHFENFYAHFSYHTGEYNFKCEGCGIKKPYKEDIDSHRLRSRICIKSNTNKIHNHLETKIIHLYICKICNFGNLNEINLKNHVRKQHGIMSYLPDIFKKCVLVARKSLEISKEVDPVGRDDKHYETDNTPAKEEDPLCAEQELPMDIQNMLINASNACDNSRSVKEASALSPEILLEKMHAPNHEIVTTEACLGESPCKINELISLDHNTQDKSAFEKSNHETKRVLYKIQYTKSMTDLITNSQSSTKADSTFRIDLTLQDSESLSSIETFVKNTTESTENPVSDINDQKNEMSEGDNLSKKAERISKKLLTSKTTIEEETNKLIEEHFEELPDSEPVPITEAHTKTLINQVSKNVLTFGNKVPCKSLLEIHLGKLTVPKVSKETMNQSTEKYFKGLHNTERSPANKTCNMQVPKELLNTFSDERKIESSTEQHKHLMIYRQYCNLDTNYFGLYKCLMEDCFYSTNSREEFKIHSSNNHINLNQSKLYDCPYCINKSSCLEKVSNHIWQHHSMSIYQCVGCSYRSMVPGNVIIHRKIYHKNINTKKSIYKCCYLSMEEKRKYRSSSENTRNNVSSLKCPDCSYQFFAVASIKLHLRNSHPETFQKFSSLNLNELACIYCNRVKLCKQSMQIHLALQHPDEPCFVIGRKEKKDCEDAFEEDLKLVDISMDVAESDIILFDECKNVNTNREQEPLNNLESEKKSMESFEHQSSTIMPLDSPNKYCRSSDNFVHNKSSEVSSVTTQTNSTLIENKDSTMKLHKMEETQFLSITQLQTTDDCCVQLMSESNDNPDFQESNQNETSKTCERVVKINLNPHPIVESLHIKSPKESNERGSILNDHGQLSDLQNKQLNEAFEKDGNPLKLLLELLVENTGVHNSTLFKCPRCNSSFMHYGLWLTHMKNNHSNFECGNCPYCTSQLQFESAETHFKSHLRHKFICYYCIATFSTNEGLIEHFAYNHDNCNVIEMPIDSFYMVMKQNAIITDYTALLQHFNKSIHLHLTKQIQRHTINEWPVNLTEYFINEMGIPQYKVDGQPLYKCFVKLCSFVGSNEDCLDSHLVLHELPNVFKCTYCKLETTYSSWDSIKFHLSTHRSSTLHVCCVCKFIHYSNEGIIKHINNLHNSRDVPVLNLNRGDLNHKVSVSIFLPPNKISFTTSKDCFCCAEEIGNSKKYVQHLKKVHKLTLCTRCQICSEIILTHINAEVHFKEVHQMDMFKLRYEVCTTYLYNLIPISWSPLKMKMHLKKEKHSDLNIDSNPNDLSLVEIKEEILVKNELELKAETQIQSISINCLDTNQLLERGLEKTYQQQSKDLHANLVQQPEAAIGNQEAEHSPNILQKQNAVTMVPTPGLQCSLTEQDIASDIPSPTQRTISGAPVLGAQSSTSSNTLLRSLLSSHHLILPNRQPSKQTQHKVIKEIQLTAGNVVVSIPSAAFETSTAERPAIIETSQRIPVITSRTPWIPEMPSVQMHQSNVPSFDEIVSICGTCHFECKDFIHLQSHYEATHASYNECFYFYVDRKIGCMHCDFRGGVSSFAYHHTIFHPDKISLCHSIKEPTRCGICNNMFRYPLSNLPPVCACPCPGPQITLADCLNLPLLMSLREIGYQYYKYSCDVCRLPFLSQQQFRQHFAIFHHQILDTGMLKTKLKYYCCMCSSMTSYKISDIVQHMKFSHLITMSLTFPQKIEYYKKIRIAYPNGFLVSLDDLRNTGIFNEQTFMRDIYNFEAGYIY
ncbi:uncharacterized protein LOC129920148 isoform X2 [Episyrphus balteatus]|nr:uncharacterized protein LOC129920148 isoform X2 [Episyrphus balteatus]